MITLNNIKEAAARIEPYINKTPLIRAKNLDNILGCKVHLKLECMQVTNSFKLRGALNRLLSVPKEELKSGVVAASSGNHGKGLAYSAKMVGLPCVIVVPETTPKSKIDGIKAFGAEVVTCDVRERHNVANEIAQSKNFTLVHPYDDYGIITGQGTAGLEIMEQLPDVDCVIVPVSGGGLIGGVATAVKAINSKVKVYGGEPAAMARYFESYKAGEAVKLEQKPTLADALQGVTPGVKNYPIVKANVDGFAPVTDEELIEAFKLMLLEGKILCEISSCIGIAAVLKGKISVEKDDKVCFVISGGSLGADQIEKLLNS